MEYINNIIGITKKSPTDPFQIQFRYIYNPDLITLYLPDGKIFLPGMSYEGYPLTEVDNDMYEVLKIIFSSIESYPYSWELNGQKLDAYGFDLYDEGNRLRFSPTALKTVQDFIGYQPESVLEYIYNQPSFAYSPFLTKLSINLEKTSVISEFAIQLQSVDPVRVAAFVYESSLSGEGHPMVVNLDELQVKESNESLWISFGKPIVVKRMTITLAQDNIYKAIPLKNPESKKEKEEILNLIEKYARIEDEFNG